MQILNAMLVVRDRRSRINAELQSARGDCARQKQRDKEQLQGLHLGAWEAGAAAEAATARLEQLRVAHLRLADVHDALNSALSLPVLAELGYIWTQSMVHAYALLVARSAYGGDGLPVTLAHLLNLARSWVAVFAICHCCDSSACAASTTQQVVARLLAAGSGGGGGGGGGGVGVGVGSGSGSGRSNGGGCREEVLERFSKQLSAVRPEFNTCGFFSIDMPFLFTFFGSMFGYLIILVQFDHPTAASLIKNGTSS